jgi:molybdopterin-guanine dinucleotide biosynthesis protein A
MGQDKALLPWGDTDLLGHALARLRGVVDEVRILPGPERRYTDRGVALDLDLAPNQGPLAGLLAALESASGRAALLLGIDLPLVPSRLLERLVALGPSVDAVVPMWPRGPEPLCAVYGAACLEPVRHRVAAGDLKMTAFWPDVRVREVGPEELDAYGDPAELFLNVNTPEDHERALGLGAGP